MVKVLVVDDQPELLHAMARLVAQAGYETLEASSGYECLQRVRQELPDLVLLDVVLPDLSGFEVCRRIKDDPATAGCTVVLLSGVRTDSDSQAAGLEIGADGYIARPIANRELLARVAAFVRLRQASADLLQKQAELAQLLARRSQESQLLARAAADREARIMELKAAVERLRAHLLAAGLSPAAGDALAEGPEAGR
jgi:DNA-binding response OmpR family regulator